MVRSGIRRPRRREPGRLRPHPPRGVHSRGPSGDCREAVEGVLRGREECFLPGGPSHEARRQ
eukprot:5485392-Pyramimonas_sp.AAC.1